MTHLLKLVIFVDHPYRLVRRCSAEVTMLPGSSNQTITISTAESTIRKTKMVKITAGSIFSLQFFIFHMKFRVFETGHRMIVKHYSYVISIFVMKYAKLQCTVAPWKTEKICNASTISWWRHWSDTITAAKSCASVYTQLITKFCGTSKWWSRFLIHNVEIPSMGVPHLHFVRWGSRKNLGTIWFAAVWCNWPVLWANLCLHYYLSILKLQRLHRWSLGMHK